MNDSILTNNEAKLIGTVSSALKFSHKLFEEEFYTFVLNVPRLSDTTDCLNITVSERLLCYTPLHEGNEVCVLGQFRSYNNYSGVGSKLVLTLFARDIKPVDDETDKSNPNSVYLNGYLCKKPIYRTTPFGREISDILLAVNRAFGKSDYIPCIAWGRNAKYASTMDVGSNLKVWGRIQSREYQKHFETGDVVNKTAFEVSVNKLESAKDAEG